MLVRNGLAQVATDVAARGIDIPELDLVVLARPPERPGTTVQRVRRARNGCRRRSDALCVVWCGVRLEVYVHRSGRTGNREITSPHSRVCIVLVVN